MGTEPLPAPWLLELRAHHGTCLHPPAACTTPPPANHGDGQQPGCQELLYSVSVLPSRAGAPAPRTGWAGAAGAGCGASPRTSGSSRRCDGTGWERPRNGSSRCRPPQPGLGCAWKGWTQWSVQDERPCPEGKGSTLSPLCPPQAGPLQPGPLHNAGLLGPRRAFPCGQGLGPALPCSGGTHARPQSRRQHFWLGGQSLSSRHRMRHSPAPTPAAAGGQSPGRAGRTRREGAGEGAALPAGG